ncbi:hypothetical protein NKZ03_17625 [Sinorhizobium meliloti]|uniref:hypothetical protein n=1 Tax=Rhizobium meliloti TaxID=382 RepID=UPI003D65DB21
MKKRYEEWKKLTGYAKSVEAKATPIPLRVLDLPGIQQLEDKLLLYQSRSGRVPPEISLLIDELGKTTFGITERDTRFEVPDDYSTLPEWSRERWEIDARYHAYEERFLTTEAIDDEAVAILLGLGLDFRDKHGWPLLCTRHFRRQAEAAARGIMGRMPDRAAVNLESWTKALERDAKEHMARKRIS